MLPIKAHAAFSTAVPSSGDTLPDSIQWMPPGRHAITAVKDGEPFEMDIEVNEALAGRVSAMLQQYRDKAAHAEGDLPFFDFNHNDAEASAHPLQMYWAGDDPRHGGIRARLQWTGAGADAIQRRTFRRFSPQFLTDEDKNVTGVGINMGGLVNRAAFRKIQPIWSRDAADPGQVPSSEFRVPSFSGPASNPEPGTRNSEHATRNTQPAPPMDSSQAKQAELTTALTQLTATVAAQGNELKAIQARLAEASIPAQAKPGQPASEPRILELEQQLAAATEANKVIARAQAERAIAAAAAEGRFAPQDQDLFRHLVDVFTANPDAGKVILARMPVNPALQTHVAGAAAGRTTLGHTEPALQFATLVKAKAGQFKGDRSRAIDAVIDECPQLYKAWREANGQPLL
ncbi:MAG TPA: phage protease [Verrucomicrobiae bacterium]|nr:phage protease [Verrucomicrobiae bacterium]